MSWRWNRGKPDEQGVFNTAPLPRLNDESQRLLPWNLEDTLLWAGILLVSTGLIAGLSVWALQNLGVDPDLAAWFGIVLFALLFLPLMVYVYFLKRSWRRHEAEEWQRQAIIEHCWVPPAAAQRILFRLIETPSTRIREDRVALVTRLHKYVLAPLIMPMGISLLALLGVIVSLIYKHKGNYVPAHYMVNNHQHQITLPWWLLTLGLFILIALGVIVACMRSLEWLTFFVVITYQRLLMVVEPPRLLFFLKSNVYDLDLKDIQELTTGSQAVGRFLNMGSVGANSPTDENKRFHDIVSLPRPDEVYKLLQAAHLRAKARQMPWAYDRAIPTYLVGEEQRLGG